MARPKKEALDYFPMSCVDDDEIKIICANHGVAGFSVIVKLYQKIFGTKGYYCEWNNDRKAVFSMELRIKPEECDCIVNDAFRLGIFDKNKYDEFGILTGEEIQLIFIEACAKRKSIKIIHEYLLIDEDDLPSNVVCGEKKNICGTKTPVYGEFAGVCGEKCSANYNSTGICGEKTSAREEKSTQSKVNKSKVNERRVKESKEEESIAEYPPSARGLADTPLNQTSSRGQKEQSISENRSSSIVTDYTNTNDTNDSPYTYHYDYEDNPPSARGLADTPLSHTSSRGQKEQSISENRSSSIVTDYTNDTNDSPYTYHYDYEGNPPSARGLADTPLNQTSSRGQKEQRISENRSSSIVTDYTNTNDHDHSFTYHYDYEEERTERDHEPEDYYGYESEESDEDYDYDDSDLLDPYLLFKEKREKDQKIYEENLKRMQDSDSRYANTSHSAAQVKNVNSPTIDDVKDYAKEECLHYVDCEWFVTYYSSHGWENVRDWRSALRRWNEKDKARTKKQLGIQNVQQTEEDYDREMLKYFEEFDRRMGVDDGV